MKHFDSRSYTVADLLEWQDSNRLKVRPDFQRRAVWREGAKSYLIDSIIRGRPMPKIILTQTLENSRTIRTIIDGQQRIQAIFGYVGGGFSISPAHNPEYQSLYYDDLPNEVQRDILSYEIGVDVLFDATYEEMLDIFSRINAYTVILNSQEKRNAKYVGYFKQCAYNLGLAYVRYWLDGRVLTDNSIARMGEAELASDLLIVLLDAVQSSKAIEGFYGKFEEQNQGIPLANNKFHDVMSLIGEMYAPAELSDTRWRRIPLFYTLFTSIAHLKFGVKGLKKAPKVKFTGIKLLRMRVKLDEISSELDDYSPAHDEATVNREFVRFADFARRRTADTAARVYRSDYLCKQLLLVNK